MGLIFIIIIIVVVVVVEDNSAFNRQPLKLVEQ